jgi:hypothetical protein
VPDRDDLLPKSYDTGIGINVKRKIFTNSELSTCLVWLGRINEEPASESGRHKGADEFSM